MHKHLIHTKPAFRKLFLIIAFMVMHPCFAQEPDTVAATDRVEEEVERIEDSVVMYDEEESYQESYFEKISAEDTRSLKKRPISDSIVNKLRKDKDFWYANEAPVRKEPPSFHVAEWVRGLVRLVVILSFLGILIWFLIASDVRLFRRSSAVFSAAEEEPIPDDIFSIDFEKEMEKARAAGNYRLVVRLMYLLVLKLMAEKNIIQYKVEKTNSDYLAQLGSSAYYQDFFRLTRDFEYAWYGKFDISETAFNRIQQDFLTLKARLH